jgi:hypothetical protein
MSVTETEALKTTTLKASPAHIQKLKREHKAIQISFVGGGNDDDDGLVIHQFKTMIHTIKASSRKGKKAVILLFFDDFLLFASV